MALTLRRTGADEYGKHLKVLIAGDPGAGKTRSASTWDKPLIASLGANLMSVADRGTDFVEITTSAELAELKTALNNTPAKREEIFGFPVNTVIIDTLDHFQEILIVERKRAMKADFQPGDWSWLNDEVAAIVRGFRNLPLHVVFHLHLKLTEDMLSGQVYFRPSLVGQMGDKIAAYVDVALAFKGSSVLNEDGSRTLHRWAQTYQDDQHPWIRDNSGQLPPEFEINFSDDFQRLYDAVYGGLELPASGQARTVSIVPDQQPIPAEMPGAPTEADLTAAQAKGSKPVKKAPAKVAPKPALPAGIEPAPEPAPAASISFPSIQLKSEPAPEPEPAPELRQVTDEEAARSGQTKEELAVTPAPEPEAAEEAAAEAALVAELNGSGPTAEELAANAATTELEPCSECGGAIETEDQQELSMVRFRKPMCRNCFVNSKRNLSASRS